MMETKSYCKVSKQVWQEEAIGDKHNKIDMVMFVPKECKTWISNLKGCNTIRLMLGAKLKHRQATTCSNEKDDNTKYNGCASF
jgi:hypothetical protein